MKQIFNEMDYEDVTEMEDEEYSTLYHRDYSRILSVALQNGSGGTWNIYDIERIYFYDDNGIITSLNHYFDDNRDFTYKGMTKLRRKIDLNRKENFIIKNSDVKWFDEKRYDVYIYHENTNIQYVGKEIRNHYYYESRWVMWSTKYKKYMIDDYVHRVSIQGLSRKLSRLKGIAGELCNNFYNVGIFTPCSDEEMKVKLEKLYKINQRINMENERLLRREELQK